MTAAVHHLDPGPRLLTRRELALLRFADRHSLAGTPFPQRRLATWEAFGIGVMQFEQQLARVLRLPAAEAAEPALVRRLLNIAGRRGRGARRTTDLTAPEPAPNLGRLL